MDAIYDLEIKIISWIQSIGGWFTPIALLFSLLGSQLFFLFLAPAIYWCYDPILGVRAGLYLSISSGINTLLKVALHSPRPYWYSSDVKALSTESTFGEPSGHAQSSVIVWGTIALYIRKWWAWILSILMIIFISFSRIYLAVHFPSDVLLGWIVGISLLILLQHYETPFLNWFKRCDPVIQILFIFLLSISFIALFIMITILIGEEVVLQTWIDTAAFGAPGSLPIDPLSLTGIVSNAGGFLGIAIGALWVGKKGWFSTQDTVSHLFLRFIIGLSGVIIIWGGFGLLVPSDQGLIPLILVYFRYAITAVWVMGAAPMIFIKLKLARHGIQQLVQ